jgi:hypothetical protein
MDCTIQMMTPIYIGLLHAGLEAMRSQQAAAMLQASHRHEQELAEIMAHARIDVIDVDARFIDEPLALPLDDRLCMP